MREGVSGPERLYDTSREGCVEPLCFGDVNERCEVRHKGHDLPGVSLPGQRGIYPGITNVRRCGHVPGAQVLRERRWISLRRKTDEVLAVERRGN